MPQDLNVALSAASLHGRRNPGVISQKARVFYAVPITLVYVRFSVHLVGPFGGRLSVASNTGLGSATGIIGGW